MNAFGILSVIFAVRVVSLSRFAAYVRVQSRFGQREEAIFPESEPPTFEQVKILKLFGCFRDGIDRRYADEIIQRLFRSDSNYARWLAYKEVTGDVTHDSPDLRPYKRDELDIQTRVVASSRAAIHAWSRFHIGSTTADTSSARASTAIVSGPSWVWQKRSMSESRIARASYAHSYISFMRCWYVLRVPPARSFVSLGVA
jgi:hypothetical protein